MIRRFAVPAALALALVPASCSTAPEPSDQVVSPVQERMFRHFAVARDLRSFSLTGDLDALTDAARELAASEETWGLPPGADAYLEEIRADALRAAEATSMEEAARAVADLSATCGSCHLANETDLGQRLQTSAPYLDDPDIRHQNQLSWISRLLWDGLVGPSERTWAAGASALAADDGYPPPAVSHVPEIANREAGETLRGIGERAASTDDPAGRAELMADLWTTCAGCHTQAGVSR